MTSKHRKPRQPATKMPPATPADNHEETVAVFFGPPRTDKGPDFGWLFTCWAWEAGFREWEDAVRCLARALRGLERIGFIERQRVRQDGKTLHAFALTEDGHDALRLLGGGAIAESSGDR